MQFLSKATKDGNLLIYSCLANCFPHSELMSTVPNLAVIPNLLIKKEFIKERKSVVNIEADDVLSANNATKYPLA